MFSLLWCFLHLSMTPWIPIMMMWAMWPNFSRPPPPRGPNIRMWMVISQRHAPKGLPGVPLVLRCPHFSSSYTASASHGASLCGIYTSKPHLISYNLLCLNYKCSQPVTPAKTVCLPYVLVPRIPAAWIPHLAYFTRPKLWSWSTSCLWNKRDVVLVSMLGTST